MRRRVMNIKGKRQKEKGERQKGKGIVPLPGGARGGYFKAEGLIKIP
jgi:hypothetical protein